MLTNTTPIATNVRGQVRAFIKGQAGFEVWINARGIESRNASNRDLLDYAIENGLSGAVEDIMQGISAPYVSIVPYTAKQIASNAQEDENVEASIMGRQPANIAATVETSAGVAGILAPVDAFLSPLVRQELEKALKPLIDAANKPAIEKIVTVEKIVERTVNLAPLPAGAMPYASPDKKASLGSVFGFKGQYAKASVTLWESHGAAPSPDPFYVVDPFNMFVLATAIERGSNVWAGGPSGSGKSTLPEQFCANVGRPIVRFNFTRQSEVADMIGGPAVMADGSTRWEDGALIQAVKRPGTVILLDELTIAPPGVQAIFQSLADNSRSYTIPNTGEKVTCAPGVVFIVADNTFGFGDETGQYAGTHAASAALVNRFARVVRIDYMDKAQESKALVNHTGAPKPACDALAEFVSRARKMPEMENVPLSLRQMTAFIHAVDDGLSPKNASQLTFLNRLPQAERAALETLFTLTWAQEFSALMSGSALDANNPVSGPSDSEASRAFDDEVSAAIVR